MEHDFQGKEGQLLPDLPDQFRWSIFQRYSELYETLTGTTFEPKIIQDIESDLNQIFKQYV